MAPSPRRCLAALTVFAACLGRGAGLRIWCVAHPFSMMENIIRLATELQNRGHQVAVGSTDKAKGKVEKLGLTFLNLAAHSLRPEEELSIMSAVSNATNPLAAFRSARVLMDGVDGALREGFAKLATAADVQLPDLLVCSFPTASCAQFAVTQKIPFVWSLPTFSMISPMFTQLPYLPTMVTDFPYGHMSAWQRFVNLLPVAVVKLVFPVVGWPVHALRDTISHVPGRLVLVPGVPGMDYPQHTAPLVQYTGPYLTPKDADPSLLSADVRAWLDRPGALPVLYISMGTVVQLSEQLCQRILEAVQGAAAAGEFRALWALPANQHSCLGAGGAGDFQGLEAPLLVSSWIPTPAALAHPSVRAFLSHCGANGAAEAVWARVPILGMPFFGDQQDNSHRLRDQGLGLVVDKGTLSAADIRQGVRRLLSEPQFEAALRRVSHLLRLYGGVARAADLVEMVHEMGGDLSFLQTPVETQGWFVACCFDLLSAAVGVLAFSCFLCGRCSVRRVPSTGVVARAKAD